MSIRSGLSLSMAVWAVIPSIALCQNESSGDALATNALTLQDCLEVSKRQNNEILKAREELQRTRGVVREGYSGAFPKLDANGSYTRFDEGAIEEFEGIQFGSDEIYGATFSLEQTLYSGGRVGAGIRAAKLADLLARAKLDTTVREVEFQVERAFYTALLARDLIDVQVEAVELFTENLKNVEAKRKEGQVSDYEVLRARVARSNIQPDLIRARNSYKLALDGLKQVVNMPMEAEIEIDGVLTQAPAEFDLDKLVEAALANRAEIKAQDLTVTLRKENIVLAKSGMRPDLSLTGSYAGESDMFGEGDATDLTWGWTVGLNVSMPLFDGFKTRSQVIQRRAEHRQSQLDLDNVVDGIKLEVRQAYFKFGEATEVLESQKKSVEQAQETVRQSRILAGMGQITQFALRDSQLELRTARTNLQRALFEYNVALARLQRAAGFDIDRLNTATH